MRRIVAPGAAPGPWSLLLAVARPPRPAQAPDAGRHRIRVPAARPGGCSLGSSPEPRLTTPDLMLGSIRCRDRADK